MAAPTKDEARELVLQLLQQTPQPRQHEIAEVAGVSARTVYRWAQAAQIPIQRGRPPIETETLLDRAVRILAREMTVAEIAQVFGVTDKAIYKRLARAPERAPR